MVDFEIDFVKLWNVTFLCHLEWPLNRYVIHALFFERSLPSQMSFPLVFKVFALTKSLVSGISWLSKYVYGSELLRYAYGSWPMLSLVFATMSAKWSKLKLDELIYRPLNWKSCALSFYVEAATFLSSFGWSISISLILNDSSDCDLCSLIGSRGTSLCFWPFYFRYFTCNGLLKEFNYVTPPD